MYKIMVLGTGTGYISIKHYINFNNVNIIAFIDNNKNKQGKIFDGKKIISMEESKNYNYDYIVIASQYYSEITKQILAFGINKDKIVQLYNCSRLFPNSIFYEGNFMQDKNVYNLFKDLSILRLASFYGTSSTEQNTISKKKEVSCDYILEDEIKSFIDDDNFQKEKVKEIYTKFYKETNEKTFQSNIKEITTYKYLFNKNICNRSENKVMVYNNNVYLFNKDFEFIKQINNNMDLSNFNLKEKIFICGNFNIDNVSSIIDDVKEKGIIYLYFTNVDDFIDTLQVCNIRSIIKYKNIIFFIGLNEVKLYFEKDQVIFPEVFINCDNSILSIIEEIKIKKEEEINILKNNINDYYENINIRNDFIKNPKILLYFPQNFYLIRDLKQSLEINGVEVKVLTEENNMSLIDEYSFLKSIDGFKPNALVVYETLRRDLKFYVHKNVVFLTWLDAVRRIEYSKEVFFEGMSNLDIILLPYLTLCEYQTTLDNHKQNFIEFPFVCNNKIYKEYDLSSDEIEKYGADICCVSNNHAEDLDDTFSNIYLDDLKEFKYCKEIELIYIDFKKIIYDEIRRTEQPIHDLNVYMKIIKMLFKKYNLNNIGINEKDYDRIAHMFRMDFGYMIYRSVVIEWIIEKKYNIKLWGSGWDKNKKLSKYCMGPINNGQNLSKIYNASKISLSIHPFFSAHTRTFESILSNSLCMIPKTIPTKYDFSNIEIYFKENEDIIFYYDKNDLYKKLEYHLQNENERKKVIDSGKRKIISNGLYYDKVFENIIKELKFRLDF